MPYHSRGQESNFQACPSHVFTHPLFQDFALCDLPPSSKFPVRPTWLLMPKVLKYYNIQSLLWPEFQCPQLMHKEEAAYISSTCYGSWHGT